MAPKLGRTIAGAIYGVLPGVILVLLAHFVIIGEWQLTIGANGLAQAFIGLVAGAVVGYNWRSS
ncbi:hypothetical protein DMH04_11385 [Kibdelosporangium aridum]|uniref:Uncharacterized protein n=1 Tax=Kibdelosporangium aridum TaxID=2030 RepID=A0A428ZFK1_KIBAR|nr:hypothetical protein [Kibdelosporangium aridum]RSM86857.1 hypothetical protein DMH04_11385 [Kibdelosporangium aridum]